MGFTKSKTNRIQRGGPFRSFTVFVAVFVVTMFSAILTHAQPTVISTNTTLDSTVMDFDGQDLVVSNCTLTITAGTHSFTSVLMTNSAQIMLQGTNGTIQNTTIAGSTNDTSIIVSNGILDGVTVNGILDVGNSIFGANLVATNGLTVNGTVLLGNLTNNSFGQIDFAGSQTLGGNGIVVFGLEPTFHNALYSHIDGASMTIGPSMTIRGQNGMIGYSFNPILSPRATTNMFVVNQGTIIADVSGGIIEIRSQITNQGTLSWSAGNLSLETPTVYNTGQIFAIGTTNVGTLKAVLISGGTIGLSNGPPVVIQNFVYFDAVTIKGTLDVGNTYSTTVLSVTNGLTLNGTILLGNPTNSNVGTLGFKGNQTLGGNGTVILGNSSNDGIISFRSGVTLTIGPGITIHGQAGNIGYNTYSLGTILSVINQGTITADVSSGEIDIDALSFTNQGILSWSAGNLFLSTPIKNSGQIFAIGTNAPALYYSSGAVIYGGMLGLTNGSSVVLIGGGLTLDGVTVNGTLDVGKTYSATSIVMTNGLTLNGTILLGNTNNFNSGGIDFAGSQTFGGNGTVVFGKNTGDALYSHVTNSTLTLGSGITVRGLNGTIGYAPNWSGSQHISLINQGTIAADITNGVIEINAPSFNNQGNLSWSAGTISLKTPVNNSGQIFAFGGTNTGALRASGTAISGGTLGLDNGSPVVIDGRTNLILDGVTVNGTLDVENTFNATQLVVTNGLTLNGTMLVGSLTGTNYGGVDFARSQTLGGNGSVLFGKNTNFDNALYSNVAGTTLTIGSGITVHGQNGIIGYNTFWSGTQHISLINQGTIQADVTGGIIYINAQPFVNQGTFSSPAGTVVIIDPVPPTSHVNSLPTQIASLQVPVTWTGQDDTNGSGIASFDIYVSDNSGAWTLWQSAITATNAVYQGKPQHTYAFKSVARDNAGNLEAQHASADASTLIVAVPQLQLTVSPATTNVVNHSTFSCVITVKNSGSATLNTVTMSNITSAGINY